jgi:hypothetical protein
MVTTTIGHALRCQLMKPTPSWFTVPAGHLGATRPLSAAAQNASRDVYAFSTFAVMDAQRPLWLERLVVSRPHEYAERSLWQKHLVVRPPHEDAAGRVAELTGRGQYFQRATPRASKACPATVPGRIPRRWVTASAEPAKPDQSEMNASQRMQSMVKEYGKASLPAFQKGVDIREATSRVASRAPGPPTRRAALCAE